MLLVLKILSADLWRWEMPGQGIGMTDLPHKFKFAERSSVQGAFPCFTISDI
jgi:hypothetical protein